MIDQDCNLPRWAVRARESFKLLVAIYVAFWIVIFTLGVCDLLRGTHLRPDHVPPWTSLLTTAYFLVWMALGLVWCAGAAVAGFREPVTAPRGAVRQDSRV